MEKILQTCLATLPIWHEVAWLEWVKTTFDLVKGISWPLAIFAMVWLFKDPIRARIPFITQVGPSGATFSASQPAMPQGTNPLQTALHPLATVNDLANKISNELSEFVQDQREPKLIRALAEARVLTEFEFIFGNIFQSQIDALRELKIGPKSLSDARSYFEERVRPINKDLYAVWDFEKWSFFLTAQNLVSVEGDEVKITPKGADFVDFVTNTKSSFVRVN